MGSNYCIGGIGMISSVQAWIDFLMSLYALVKYFVLQQLWEATHLHARHLRPLNRISRRVMQGLLVHSLFVI
jgi:hypothetical protein